MSIVLVMGSTATFLVTIRKIRLVRQTITSSLLVTLVLLVSNCGRTDISKAHCPDDFSPITLSAGRDFIYDNFGRVALFRGVNVPGQYTDPFRFNEGDLEAIKYFGFNFIRLGISWRKAEPSKGKYDQDLFESYKRFIEMAGEKGIFVMIEVHQFLWCNAEESYIPDWICSERNSKDDLNGVFKEADRFWSSPEVRMKLARFWRFLAEYFRETEGFFGYDILNEPLSNFAFSYGDFEKNYLFPFYRETIAAIREVDSNRPIILEPHIFSAVMAAYTEPLGFSNLLYSPHPYFPHTYTEAGLVILNEETPEEVKEKYIRIAKEAEKMDMTILVGEFGAPYGYSFSEPWIKESIRMQDLHFLSSAYWVYYPPSSSSWSIVQPDRTPRETYVRLLRRPYPRFTAGRPLELSYSYENKEFYYRYRPQARPCAPTMIYAPDIGTWKIDIIGADEWYLDPLSEILIIGKSHAQEVVVRAKKD